MSNLTSNKTKICHMWVYKNLSLIIVGWFNLVRIWLNLLKFSKYEFFVLFFCFISNFLFAGYKSAGSYEIITDVFSTAGNTTSSQQYLNDSSLISFSTFYDVIGSTEVISGYLQNINNLPLVFLTTPYNETWAEDDTVLFKWEYFDYDNNSQAKFQVVLSTTADFSGTDYGSGIVSSSSTQWESFPLDSATYYWYVKVWDSDWYEYSFSTYSLKFFCVDKTSPTLQIVNWDINMSSITVYVEATDTGSGLHSLPYRFHISTSSNFETNITTTTSWVAQSSWTFTGLTYNTTYYFKVQARDKFYNTTTVVQPKVTLATPPKLSANPWQTITNTSIQVSWALDETPPNPDNTIYAVEISSDINFSFIFSSSGIKTDQQLTVSGLTPNTTYYARVVAYNWEGTPASTYLSGWHATLCSTPSANWSSIWVTSMVVSWTNPFPSNPLNTKYIVELSSTNFVSGQVYSSSTVCGVYSSTITGLSANTTYYARVKAVNWEGEIQMQNLAIPKSTLANLPLMDRFSNITNTSITINWQANGNPEWTKYYVQVSSYGSFSPPSSDGYTYNLYFTTSGLIPNTTYWFRVQSINNEGVGSGWMGPVSTHTLCSEPSNLSWSTITSTTIQVSWGSSEPDNPLDTIYIVEISTMDNFTGVIYSSQTTRGSSSAIISDLTPNTTYYARVKAVNLDNIVSTRTLSPAWKATYCSVPVAFWSNIWITSMTINWTNPEPSNPLNTKYIIELSSTNFVSGQVYSSSTVCGVYSSTITGLSANTTYYARVKAVNWEGVISTGTLSPLWHATLANLPVFAYFSNISPTSIKINWNSNNNPEWTVYELESSTKVSYSFGLVWASTGNSFAHFGLLPNVTYYYRIRAKNIENVYTDYADFGSTRTYCYPAGEITFVSVSSYSILLSWGQNNNPSWTTYEVEVSTKVSNQFSYLWVGTTNTLLHTGLQPNTTYYYRVRAKNLDGVYTEYNTAKSTTTKPSEVFGLFAQQISTSTILWQWQSVEGAVLYNIYSTTATEKIAEISSPTTSWQQSGLLPNTSYTIEVSAVNFYGQEGVRSVAVSTYTLAEAFALSLLNPTTWTLQIQINSGNNPEYTKYAIKFSTNGSQVRYVQDDGYLAETPVYKTKSDWSTIVAKGLTENVRCDVRVLARNELGLVNESTSSYKYTLLNPPTYFVFTAVYYSSLTVSVPPPPNANSGLTGCEFENTIGGSGPSGRLTGIYTFTFRNLYENTKYGYKVKYYNGDGVATDLSSEFIKYTLVLPPSTFTIVAISSGSLRLQTNEFQNYNEGDSGYYFYPSAGQPGSPPSSGWIRSNVYEPGGLLPNTTYTYNVMFRNADRIETSTLSATGWTLAQAIDSPQVIDITTSTLKIIFDPKQNPYWTEYSIKVLSYGNTYYLQSDYTLAYTEIFMSTMSWGSPITIKNLTPNVEYNISVNARNLKGFVAYGLSTTTRTYAEIPGQPYIVEVTSGSIKIAIDPKNNSSETTYLIKCLADNTTKYVQQGGTLGDSPTTYLTYQQWGGTVNVVGLYAGTIYEFSVQARNGYGHLTEFSSYASTITFGSANFYVVDVTTYSVTIAIHPIGLSPTVKYAIKDIIGQTTYYVKLDGSLDISSSPYYTISGWGGVDTATITVLSSAITPNQLNNFYLGIKDINDNDLYPFTILVSTYTLSEQVDISLYSVFSDSVSVVLNPKNNPYYTEYSLKCIADGTTYYLQQDHTLGTQPVWLTSSSWQNNSANGEWYVIVSTPNLPVEIEVKSRNVLSAESDYSNRISTWTAILVPEAPTVIGCYDYIKLEGESQPYWKYFTRIFINSRNSKYTEYAIKIGPAGNYFLRSVGDGAWDQTESWLTKEEWNNNKNINSVNTANQNLGPDQSYTYFVKARSIARQEVTVLSLGATGKTPSGSFPVSVQEIDNDKIRVSWQQIDSQTGVTRYDIYANGSYFGSVPVTTTNYDHDIDGGKPQKPQNITTQIHGNSIIISWDAVSNPQPSAFYSYKVYAVAEVQGSTYTIVASQQSSQIQVTPTIKSYIVYCLETNTTYYTSFPTITIEGLAINTTYNFYISALSSDDIESDKSEVSLYLEYSTSELDITDFNISSGKKHNGVYIGVKNDAEIKIEFNKVIDTNTVNNNTVYLKAIRDNKNNPLDKVVNTKIELSYVDNRSLLLIKPQTDLDYGYKYRLVIDGIYDLNTPANYLYKTYEFETLYDLILENKIVAATTVYIEITNQQYTADKRVYLEIEESVFSDKIFKAERKLSYDKVVLNAISLNMYDENGNNVEEFDKFLYISISYQDKDADGYIDNTNPKIKIDTISIWYLDEEKEAWMKLPTTIDKINKVLKAKVKHLSVFAIIGALNYSTVDVKVYPVPWIPEDGKAITGTLQDGIRFINLPVEGQIYIYTITGELVRKIEFDANDNGQKVWDGNNDDGKEVASGVYLWLVKSRQDKKTGKLIVIR